MKIYWRQKILINRQLYTMKFKSSRLKEYGYDIQLTPQQAKQNGELIALSDNQILRSIRKITGKEINYIQLEQWYKERDRLKKQIYSKENSSRIIELQNNILDMLFIPEYITIVMEHNSHYNYLFKNGLLLNSERYFRLSSSASQSRVSTVVFCNEKILNQLNEILDNNRDKNIPLCPSKYNAYKGLSGSSTKIVSTPKFCVVPDYEIKQKVNVNFVTETEENKDDDIVIKEVELSFNRFDGQGLIKPSKAKEWAEELGLDYIPGQFCVRQNFLKGMLCVFDIDEYCENENHGNYIINTIYKDNNNPIQVDLRDIDVVVSESQFKLWNAFGSLEEYIHNCEMNDLKWGVSLTSPKKPNDILKMNYQFLQTLDLNQKDIKKICTPFVDWVTGVNFDNIYYTLLFLLGENITQESIQYFLKYSNNYWLKSLIVNHELKNDKYIRDKVYKYTNNIIKRGCLGEIILDGNFQVLVSDPYAMMQHICGQKVTGLLKEKEYYCNYWNKKNICVVDSMRAPLTYKSEHLKLNLINHDELNKWYKYCDDGGVIVNIHGYETLNWAGSDWDFDIIATTSDQTILNSIFQNELPVVYDTPKSISMVFTEEDLYKADLFAFGSIIGSITNKSTSAYALLPLFNKESLEYQTLINRLKMCTKLQSAQIDKAKIGKKVKGIPKIWIERQKIYKDDDEKVKKEKEFLNKILLDKHPYFFIHLYKNTYNKYKKYVKSNDLSSQQKFGLTLNELLIKENCNEKEQSFVDAYYRFLPVIDSDSVMNLLCKHIENVDFDIKSKLKTSKIGDLYKLYMKNDIPKNQETYQKVLNEYKKFMKELKDLNTMGINQNANKEQFDEESDRVVNNIYDDFRNRMFEICSYAYELTNYLVEIFYCEYKSSNKDILWNSFGKYIFSNIKSNTKESIFFPMPNKEGGIIYLNKKYKLEEVII